MLIGLIVFVVVLTGLSPRAVRKLVRRARKYLRRFKWSARRTLKRTREQVTGMLPGASVTSLRAIDGDTLEDPQTGIRYRLANIDCPETDDRAKCYRERIKGEQAKGAAQMILASAKALEIRPAGIKDRYNRAIAHIRVDGQDFGELMIARGFARRWNGRRESWCGADGGLAVLARASGDTHSCKTCSAGVTREPAHTHRVVRFPVANNRASEKPASGS